MTPHEFYRLTPYEFDRMLEGWKLAYTYERRGQAVWVANLMNATGNMKEAVTPESLMSGTSSQKLDMDKLRLRAEERRKERIRERERTSGR